MREATKRAATMSTTPTEQPQQTQPDNDATRQLDRDVRDLGTFMAMDFALRNLSEPDQRRGRGPRR
jgi:hypothetical protein